MTTRYGVRRAAGLCPSCGRPPVEGSIQCEGCRERARFRTAAWRASQPIEQRRAQDAVYRARRKVETPHRERDFSRAVRREVIAAYGGRCACCGESQYEFLALDHIDGGGKAERAAVGSNLGLFLKLRREGWPQGRHRVLCHNCNMATAFYGACPHQQHATLKAV